MKPTFSLLFTAFFCLLINLLSAQPVDITTAKRIAENHLNSIIESKLKSASNNKNGVRFTSVKATVQNNDTLYYILNDTINKGFVIVSADKRAWPILGYSTEGNFDEKKQPDAFNAWMESRKKEIESIKKNNLQPDEKTSEYWNQLSLKNAVIETSSVEPLIKTKWGQGCFYNELCPSDIRSPFGGHVPTGCVATATAQIMKYWNYPTKGSGLYSYQCSIYGRLTAEYGSTTYQWNEMPDRLETSNNAVATLMLHCGIAADMIYGPKSSGSYVSIDPLIKYFNYSSDAEFVDKREFTHNNWLSLLKNELDMGRPIYYWGSDIVCGGGHVFVCDGYQSEDYFHFNWGWDGIADGYFYLDNLNPMSFDFSFRQYAIIKIFPESMPDGFKGITLSTNTIGFGISGGTSNVRIISDLAWTASSDQSWLNVNNGTGQAGNNSLSFSASANTSNINRKAIITIKTSENSTKTIEVTQYGKFETSAGNLKTVLEEQLSSITHLTLSGSIDARDFKTMRDEMPVLTEIDISNVKVESYTGTEGTITNYNWSYPENSIPNYAFSIPSTALSKTRLKSIILPNSITSINDYAFYGCKNLHIESLPASVTTINDGAFLECSSTSDFTIPAATNHIGADAFNSFNGVIKVDSNNADYSSLDGILYNKLQTRLLQCPISKTGSLSIPLTVTSIRNNAFLNCVGLTQVTIPSSVNSIESLGFMNCVGLSEITIPSSVISLGQRVFGGFKGSINVVFDNPNYSSSDGVLYNKEKTELIECPTSKSGVFIIPNSVKKVTEEAFHSCTDLSSMVIPQSVKSIGTFSFNCKGLGSIYCYAVNPPAVKNSSTLAFSEIDTLNCVLYVPLGAISSYRNNKQWTTFQDIREIPGYGLYVSDNSLSVGISGGDLSMVLSSSENWTVSSNQPWVILSTNSGNPGRNEIQLRILKNSLTERKAIIKIEATGIEPQLIEVIQYGSTEISAGNLKAVLGNNLSEITDLSLSGTIDARDFKVIRDLMPELKNLDIKNTSIVEYRGSDGTYEGNVTYGADEIPFYAFYNGNIDVGKKALESIILPISLKSIGNSAFGRCSGIDSINISAEVKYIDNMSFVYFNGLFFVSSENPNYSSTDGILYNKGKTTLIKMPGSKTGDYIIPSTVTTILSSAIAGSESIGSITIPSSIIRIEEGTFANCSSLNSISIPSSVKFIGRFAFTGCRKLQILKTYSNIPVDLSNSMDVFSGVDQTKCILYVPYNSANLYSNSNQWQDFKNIFEMPGFILSSTTAYLKSDKGSNGKIEVSSNVECSVSSDKEWLNATIEKVDGKSVITFEASENSSKDNRSAVITVSANSVESQTIILIQNGSSITGIDPLNTTDLNIYPNPTSGKIKIKSSQIPMSGYQLVVTDINGKIVLRKHMTSLEDWVDLNGNPPGVYFITTDLSDKKSTKVILTDVVK